MPDNAMRCNHKPLKKILVTTYAKNSQTFAIIIKDNRDGMSSKVKRKMFMLPPQCRFQDILQRQLINVESFTDIIVHIGVKMMTSLAKP